MTNIEIVGHLTKDAEYQTINGKEKTVLIIASNMDYKDKNGIDHNHVDFFLVNCWGKLAKVAGFLRKGNGVTVKGKAQFKAWTDEDEVPKRSLEITASRITLSLYTVFAKHLYPGAENTIGSRKIKETDLVLLNEVNDIDSVVNEPDNSIKIKKNNEIYIGR